MSHNLSFVRSDAAGTDVVGSVGTPVTLTVANTYGTGVQSGFTDVRDYDFVSWFLTIPFRNTGALKLTIKIEWSEATNLSQQGAELVTGGAITVSPAEFEFDITGLTGPFTIETLPLPVAGPNVKISIKVDVGTTTTVYARAWRKA